MKIGIDAQTILNPEIGDAAGLGHYTYQLIKYLIQIDQKNEYVLFFNYRVRDKDIKKFDKGNVKIRRFPFSYYKKFLPVTYSQMLTSAFFLRDKLDVLFVPGGDVPFTYQKNLVITAYGLATKKNSELFSKKEVIKNRIKFTAFNRAKFVIVTSNSAKKDVEKYFPNTREKTRVIYNAFDEKFFQSATVAEIQKVKDKYNIKGEYILFMNTIKPLNNLTRLIEAFSKLRLLLKGKKPNLSYKLVLAGKNGWLANEVHQIAKDFGLKKEIIFPGYIEPEDLNALFIGADLFVSVPIYEEFGATVLEAMACGVPIVCSNISSLCEITNGATLTVNPYDVEGIKCAILKILDNNKIRNDLRKKGLQQAKKFHWKKTAEETLSVLEDAVD